MQTLVLCPGCGRKLRGPRETLGKTVRCPNCGRRFTAQAVGDEPTAPPPNASVSETARSSGRPDDFPPPVAAPRAAEPSPPLPNAEEAAWVLPIDGPAAGPPDLPIKFQGDAAPVPKGDRVRPAEPDDPREKTAGRKRPLRTGSTLSLKEKRSGKPKALWVAAIAGACLVGLGVCGVVGYALVNRIRDSVGVGSSVSWQAFSPPQGKCRVQMPGTPKYQQKVEKAPWGQAVIHIHTVPANQRGMEFFIAVAQQPDFALRVPMGTRLDGLRDEIASNLRGRVEKETVVSIGRYQARELEIKGPEKMRLVGRVAVVGRDIYQVFVAGPNIRGSDEDVRKYLDSFELLYEPSAPPTAVRPPPSTHPAPPAQPLYTPPPARRVVFPPPALEGGKVTRPLPGPVGEVVVGGGGRYLVLRVAGQRQVAVFDVSQGRVSGTLIVGEDNVRLAAGVDHLIVVECDGKTVRRYQLATLRQEATAPLGATAPVVAVAMGSASSGPLLVATSDPVVKRRLFFFDIFGMRKLDIEAGSNYLTPDPATQLRASADGKLFTCFARGAALTVLFSGYAGPQRGDFQATNKIRVPSADGRAVHSPDGLFSPASPPGGIPCQVKNSVPADAGNYFVALRPKGAGADQPGGLSVHVTGDARPLLQVTDAELDGIDAWEGPLSVDKRVHFLPDAKLLITLPGNGDRLVLQRVDVETAFAKTDALFVTSQPPPTAMRGRTYTYAMAVKPARGKLQYRLVSGPPEMRVSPAGRVVWRVPAIYNQPTVDAVIAVRSQGGREVRQSFRVNVLTDNLAENARTPLPPPATTALAL